MSWFRDHCGNVLRPSQDLIPSTLWLLTPTPNVLGIIRRSQHHAPRVPTFFAQNPCHTPQGDDENGYLFPPAFLIGPALQHIRETGATVTLLVPDIFPRPYWWPILCHSSGARYLLAQAGDPTALIWPSRTHGFSKPKYMPLPWDLWAFRITRTDHN